ncbi:MAG: ATP-binding cassette domain-containing protein [Spirochaetaceae bacterium]|jgi:molybdate transport system ATP-binding protein|nr:ATP-binding cassette domain-containing protein [Spirochaetaceae bacterium]
MSLVVRIKKRLSADFTLDVEFQTEDYQCLGVLGASGCGKSMTLKCIAGIEKPDEGFIALDGRVLFSSALGIINLKARERKVGYLFQNYALFPKMTALENMCAALPGALSGVLSNKNLSEARGWIERFGLSGLEKNYPHQMSGGQQQRVALARMLITHPAAVLLDEPFAALDSNLREYMQLELLQLIQSQDEGALAPFKNAILVTHSREEVYRLCPRLLIMAGGKIVAQGNTRQVFDKPDSVISAELTGCKNISRIIRKAEREVFALDWGLLLRTAEVVGSGMTHIGIRAHNLQPISAGSEKGYNEVRLGRCKTSSGPFEDLVVFTNAEAKDNTEQHEIWWKSERASVGGAPPLCPEKLFFPPESLLLLKES